MSDLYFPGYNPRQSLAKDSNLSRTAPRYKVDTTKISTVVRPELSSKKNSDRSEPKIGKKSGNRGTSRRPALAQQQRQRGQGQGQGRGQGRGGFGFGPGMLIRNEGVQKELKLDGDQIEKATAAVQKVQDKHADDRAKLQDLEGQERFEKMMALNQAISAETMKALEDVLKPEQIKRLKQIQLQQRGVDAFTDPEVEKALKLTSEQKEKIKTIAGDAAAQRRELFQPGGGADFQEMQKKMAALQKTAMENVSALLHADQKQAWKDMIGQPFEVQFPGRRGRQP